jgi:hypothetical protein
MLEDEASFVVLPKRRRDHLRGRYPSIDVGVIHAPGDPKKRMVHNLTLETKEENLLNNPEQIKLRGYIQQFVESM